MKAALALVVATAVAGCLQPPTAAQVEQAWTQCSGGAAAEYRLGACSTVIAFAGSTPERRAAALVARGAIRAQQGQFARAVADFGRALRLDHTNAGALVERGYVHQQLGAYDAALRDYDAALVIQPGFELAMNRRAEAVEFRSRAFDTQLAELNEALTRAPTDANTLNNRCWLRAINDTDLQLALADCNASLLAEPGDAATLDSRGLVNLKLQNYAAAQQDYEAALAKEPQRGHYLYGRGLARIGLGQTAEGQADLAEAERLEPGVAMVYRTYGESHLVIEAD